MGRDVCHSLGVDPESKLIQAKSTLETMYMVQAAGLRDTLFASIVSASVLVIDVVVVVVCVIVITWLETRAFASKLYRWEGNHVVREGNVENKIGTDCQFDFSIYLALTLVLLFPVDLRTLVFDN